MPPVLVALFWAWFLVSIVVLVRRRAAKRAAAGTAAEQDLESPADPDAADEEPVEARVHAFVGAAPAAPSPARLPAPPTDFETPVTPTVDRPMPRSAPAAGLADALVGIRMPCDLVPLVLNRLANDRITLSTTGHPAEAVGTALADEVERLGYVLRPVSDHEVLATRGATEMRLTIHPPDAEGRHFEHPTARENSIIVEIVLL
jgi:hypothetical protein